MSNFITATAALLNVLGVQSLSDTTNDLQTRDLHNTQN